MGVTLRFQSSGAIPGSGAPVAMAGQSLTIGRGDENDLVLPDPDRVLSKRHCVVENQAGNVVVVDISTNGTFLNYAKSPLGPTPTPLSHGDILTLGPYELIVDIEEQTEPLLDPLLDAPVAGNVSLGHLDEVPSGVDPIDALLGDRNAALGPSSVQRPKLGDDGLLPPLDDAEILTKAEAPLQGASATDHAPSMSDHISPPSPVSNVIPDDWDDDLIPARPPEILPVPPRQPGPFGQETNETPSTTVPAEPDQSSQTSAAISGAEPAALAAFFEALGTEHPNGNDEDLARTMARLGEVLRLMVHGVREILMTRADIKSEFRVEQTTIKKGGNNPLKFSVTPEQAIDALLQPQKAGYLRATEAVEEALRDIKAHEVATITGMDAALKGILEQLDPARLETKIDDKGGFNALLKSKKTRYWEVYEDLYAEISDQAENDFRELFSREFARAYVDQLARLKREDQEGAGADGMGQ